VENSSRDGILDHLTCLLRNLYADQEATARTGHGATDWFQIGKEVCQGCILSPCLFNLYTEYIMRNTGLDEAQAGIISYNVITGVVTLHHFFPILSDRSQSQVVSVLKEKGLYKGMGTRRKRSLALCWGLSSHFLI